jgi:hypothetical protein
MAEAILERVMQDVKHMTSDEQQQLHTFLETLIFPSALAELSVEEREGLFIQRLVARGLLTHLPARNSMPDETRRHPPIIVQGEPVSETVIRERR